MFSRGKIINIYWIKNRHKINSLHGILYFNEYIDKCLGGNARS